MVLSNSERKEILYKKAILNYKDENYLLASSLFENYYKVYPEDSFSQEALFKSAYCYFLISPDFDLDQQETHLAIEKFQLFIYKYPDSEKIPQINDLIDQLRKKLEKKAFFLAENYHKMERYKESVIVFSNFILDFPESDLKEKAWFYKIDSQYQYAKKSKKELKKERGEQAFAMCDFFLKKYPNSNFKEKVLSFISYIKEL